MLTNELISRLVIAHELKPNDPLLRDEYFANCADQWRFLKDYHARFDAYPNVATFQTQFPDFEFIETENTAQWLADEVTQEYLDIQLQAQIAKIDFVRAGNPRQAIEHLQQVAREFLPYLSSGLNHTDLFDPAPEVAEAARRRENKNLTGITFGFELLDEVLKGTQRGEIEVYFARPGIGKSFILLYGAIQAARSGKKVSFVSPEMERFEMGTRLQSFVLHVSALELVSGEMDEEDWNEYLQTLLKLDDIPHGPFRFYEPIGMGRPFTTADVLRIIKQDDPHLVCIDGIMLIEPMLYDKDIRKRIINTMEELKQIVVETGVPIRLAHQANRQVEATGRRRTATLNQKIPDLHHMAESGSVEQYANRAIALQKLRGKFYMAIRKNRNGPAGQLIQMEHDINHGKFRDIRIVDGDEDNGAELTKQVSGIRRF